jgi:AcrR family transcriptional regulator
VPSPLHYLDDPVAREHERRAFVAAALDLLAETDSVDLQVNRVVQRAGRHNAAFYRVFESKDRLTLAVVEEATRRTAAVVERHVDAAGSPPEAVRAWAGTLLAVASGGVARWALALALDRHRLLHRFPHAEVTLTLPLREPLARILRGAGGPHADVIAEAAFEMVMSRQATWIALGHQPTDDELATYVALTVHLVGLGHETRGATHSM